MAVETFEGQTKTISASKLMGRDVGGPSLGKVGGGPYGGTSATGKLAGIVKGNKKAIAVNAEKITRLKKIADLQSKKISGDDIGSKLPTEETSILDSLDNILEALRKEQAAKDKLDAEEKKRKENKKRKMKESGLEKSLKVIKKQGEKMLAPVTNMFEKLKNGLLMLLAGKAVLTIFDWFQNPDNEKKIQTVFRFLSDFWPAIVGGLLLFMPMIFGPAGFVIMLGALIIGFLPKLISATKQLFGFGQQTEKDADAANKDLKDVENDAGNLDGAATADAVTSDDIKPIEEKGEQLKKAPAPGSGQAPTKPVAMRSGGVVPGSGPNKDTIPAMLTPGEFVMSRGAVQQYGTDTLASMNAMGGGTNRPTITNNVVYANTGGQMGGKEEPGGRNKDKNEAFDSAQGKKPGGLGAFFSGIGKGVSDFFGGMQQGMESAADTKGKKGGGGGSADDKFAKDMIKVHEGLRLDKYMDSRGFPTIGYGHLIEEGETMPDRISQQKADELFDKDYEHHKAAAMKIPGYDKADGMQKAALIDLTFNMGPAWASGFPAFKKAFAAGNYEQAGNELVDSAWYGQVGRRAPAIVNLIKGKGADNVAYLKDVPKPAPGSSQPQIASSGSSSPPPVTSPSPSGSKGSMAGLSGKSSTPKMVASKPKPVVGQPVKRGGTSTEALANAEKAKQSAAQASPTSGGGGDIPDFSAVAFRSIHKIKTLGITA
jgi:GH24 family phage-related lysozyme (muramidase)